MKTPLKNRAEGLKLAKAIAAKHPDYEFRANKSYISVSDKNPAHFKNHLGHVVFRVDNSGRRTPTQISQGVDIMYWVEIEENHHADNAHLSAGVSALSDSRYLYTPLYRPPYFDCLPKGWELEERPAQIPNNFERRTDVPVSIHRYGIISYQRQLTKNELQDYDLYFVGVAS